MTDLPQGWYDDGSGRLRWWTGQSWSEHVQASAPAAAVPTTFEPAASAPAAPSPAVKRRAKWPFVVGGVLVLLVAVGIGGVALIISLITGAVTAPGTPGAAVVSFNAAIDDDDCDLFFSVTSEQYRADSGIDDCAAFSAGAASANEATAERTVTVTGFQSRNSDATVTTEESLRDSDGEYVDVSRTYTLLAVRGEWQVTGIATD